MHNSSAGADLVKITGFDPDMTVRAFLVKLLPEIDLPSVHAVDTAFKEDGVEKMGELLSYLQGGVLGMTDLKNYSKQGKLDMAHTLKLSQAVEHLLAERVRTAEHNNDSRACTTLDRAPPRTLLPRKDPSSSANENKNHLDLINKVIGDTFSGAFAGAFDVVSDRVKEILQAEDDQESGDDTDTVSPIEAGPEHEQEQENERQIYIARRSSAVDTLGPQTLNQPPPPSPLLPPSNKRVSMTNMAAISGSKALLSGSLLKLGGRRRSGIDNSNRGANITPTEDSLQNTMAEPEPPAQDL